DRGRQGGSRRGQDRVEAARRRPGRAGRARRGGGEGDRGGAREMNRICAALDLPDPQSAAQLAAKLVGHVGLFKIGLELFVGHGHEAVRAIQRFGLPIFLDLKLHDIPQTVESAARGVAKLGIQYLTVHASGGAEMIRAGKRALTGTGTKLLAVTVLTSLGDDEQRAAGIPADAVPRLARLAVEAGA